MCQCANVPMCKCVNVQVCQYASVPMSSVPMCKWANVQVSKCASVQMCKYANVQMCILAIVQMCKFANVQVCNCASMQMCKYENMQVYKCASIHVCWQVRSVQLWARNLWWSALFVSTYVTFICFSRRNFLEIRWCKPNGMTFAKIIWKFVCKSVLQFNIALRNFVDIGPLFYHPAQTTRKLMYRNNF